jgi:hypothetical protein
VVLGLIYFYTRRLRPAQEHAVEESTESKQPGPVQEEASVPESEDDGFNPFDDEE